MTTRHRLLIAAGGTGGFQGPAVLDLSASPDGTWASPAFPKAVGHVGYTYFGWVNTSSGDLKMAAVQDSTGTVTVHTVHAGLGGDNHNSPSFLVRSSDHKLLIGYSAHDGPHVLLSISVNSLDSDPTISGGFAAEQSLLGAGDYTYVSLVQLGGVANTPIYLSYRNESGGVLGRLAYIKSTDGGASWSAETLLYTGPSGHTPYWRIATDWDRYIHVVTTDVEPGTSDNVYHFYLDGSSDKVYKSDGTEITATKPFDYTALTLVKSGSGGTMAVQATCLDATTGRPAVALEQQTGGTTLSARNVRWNGSAWVDVEVTTTTYFAANHFLPTLGLHPTNPDLMLVPKPIAGKYEMFLYSSTDGGSTWTSRQWTSSSSVDQFWPEFASRAGRIFAIWQSGTYTSDTDVAAGIRAYRL